MIIRFLNAVEGAKDVRSGEQYTVYSVHLVDVEVPPGVMDCPVMGRVALWPGRRPESIAVGRFRSQEFSQEFEDVAVAVSEHSDHRSTCSNSARIDRRLSAHRP